jgi:hypothetical protein
MARKQTGAEDENCPDDCSLAEIYRITLESVFREAAKQGRFLTIEGAISEMSDRIQALIPRHLSERAERRIRPSRQKSSVARLKQTYHLAVDLFFKTYCPEESKVGAPALADEELSRVEELREQHRSWRQIAIELGEPDAADKYRKRYNAAKKRRKPLGDLPSGKNSPD